MGGGGKGGSQSTNSTTEVKLPPWVEDVAKENLAIADEVAAIGYTPNTANYVAGMSPQQLNSMAGVDQAAQAFGMPNVGYSPNQSYEESYRALTGMNVPTANRNNYGIAAYSPYEQYLLDLEEFRGAMPAAAAGIESMVVDPQTGVGPLNPAVPMPQFDARAYMQDPVGYRRAIAENEAKQRLDAMQPKQEKAEDPYYMHNGTGVRQPYMPDPGDRMGYSYYEPHAPEPVKPVDPRVVTSTKQASYNRYGVPYRSGR